MSMRVQGEGTAQTEPSSLGASESTAPWGISFHEISGYVTSTHPGAKLRKLSKIQKYSPKFMLLSKGMTCSVDIIPTLIRLKFEDHDLLLLKDVRDELYQSVLMGLGAPFSEFLNLGRVG